MSGFRARALIVSSALCLCLTSTPVSARLEPRDRIDESEPWVSQLIIKAASPDARRDGLAREWSALAGEPLAHVRQMAGGADVWRLARPRPQADAERIAQRIAAAESVAYAAADGILRAFDPPQPAGGQSPDLTPNDPSFGSQWHLKSPATGVYGINAVGAWDVVTGSGSVVVAVIDTGALFDHPDMAGKWLPGYDMVSDPFMARDGDGRDANAADPGDWSAANECGAGYPAISSSWHGTHVAGTVGAATHNGIGVAGVDWNARIVPIRVLGRCGGTLSDFVDSLYWAVGLPVPGAPANPHPAKVLNISMGGGGECVAPIQDAVNAVRAAGATMAVAAGNSSVNASGIRPANCAGVIAVASTSRTGQRAFYSNYGAIVTIAAPGGDMTSAASYGVLSTSNAGSTVPAGMNYKYEQGTSQAAPHVAGTIALMLAADGSLSPDWVKHLVRRTATAFPAGSTCNTTVCGSGIVNAHAAVQAVRDGSANRRLYLPLLDRGSATPLSALGGTGRR